MKNSVVVGAIEISREDREQGTILRVHSLPDNGHRCERREMLRFDAFSHHPHYHLDPKGQNTVLPIPANNPLEWTFHAISERLVLLLSEAGFHDSARSLDQTAIGSILTDLMD